MRRILLVLALSGLSHPVWAAPSVAEQSYETGRAAVRRGDFEGGRVAFAQAYRLDPQPKIIWNLAICELRSGFPIRAMAHFHEYLRLGIANDQDRQHARRLIAEAESMIGRFEIVLPAGAELTVDGTKLAERAPFSSQLELMPGSHVLEATLDGYRETVRLSVAGGQFERIEMPLRRESAPAPQRSLSPPKTVHASTSAWPPPPATLVLAGIAAVAVGGGVALHLDARSRAESINADRNGLSGRCHPVAQNEPCRVLEDRIDRANTTNALSIGLFVTGGVALAAGAVLWGIRETAGSPKASWIAPSIGPNGEAGMAWGSRF